MMWKYIIIYISVQIISDEQILDLIFFSLWWFSNDFS